MSCCQREALPGCFTYSRFLEHRPGTSEDGLVIENMLVPGAILELVMRRYVVGKNTLFH